MKICIIDERYPPRSEGGASNYAKRSADLLSSQGDDVVVITTKPYDGFQSLRPTTRMDGGVKVIEFVPLNIYDAYKASEVPIIFKPIFHLINLWNPHHYFALRRLLVSETPDIVHVHTMDNVSLSLFDAVRNLGIPLVVTLHGFTFLCPKVTLIREDGEACEKPPLQCSIYRRLRRLIIDGKPDVVTAPSQFFLDFFSRAGFFGGCEMYKTPLFVESDSAQGMTTSTDNREDGFNILYVGRLGYHKGVHVLLQALKNLPFSNVSLHIVGFGDYESSLREISGSDKRVHFHGRLDPSQLHGHYSSADVTVVPSLCFENSPSVIYESLSEGTPVIASRIGGIPELIRDGYNGFLFLPGDVSQLKRILVTLIKRRALLNRLKEHSRESVGDYVAEEHIKKLGEIYERVVISSR